VPNSRTKRNSAIIIKIDKDAAIAGIFAVYLYCFLLPFGLVGSIGIMTPVISVLVAYTFMALECLAAEIEEPCGSESFQAW
jgi:predicted membrane chloride channel (bestrophin family)